MSQEQQPTIWVLSLFGATIGGTIGYAAPSLLAKWIRAFKKVQTKSGFKPLIICGPSASGKSTTIKRLQKDFPGKFEFLCSLTTRPQRPGELSGKEYTFVSRSEFERKVAGSEMVEFATVHNNFYGTPKAELQRIQAQHRIGLLDIDIQGAQQIYDSGFPANAIFVRPPTFAELEARLRARKTEAEEQVQTRLKNSRREIERADHSTDLFYAIVINDRFELFYSELKNVLHRLYPDVIP